MPVKGMLGLFTTDVKRRSLVLKFLATVEIVRLLYRLTILVAVTSIYFF